MPRHWVITAAGSVYLAANTTTSLTSPFYGDSSDHLSLVIIFVSPLWKGGWEGGAYIFFHCLDIHKPKFFSSVTPEV